MSAGMRVARRDDVWTISLARAEKRNALSGKLVDDMLAIVEEAPAEGAKLLVFRGEGSNFSAGFDFTGVEEQSEGDLLLRFTRLELLLQAVATSPCFTVGLAHGRNFGAGVDLIAACRLRVAAPGTTFRMPGLKFGLVLGARRFGDIVGREQAARILESADTFDANQAARIGFVHEVKEPEAFDRCVENARTRTATLPAWSRDALYRVLSPQARSDGDLAWLVRSAARPGLKQRIADYLNGG